MRTFGGHERSRNNDKMKGKRRKNTGKCRAPAKQTQCGKERNKICLFNSRRND